MALLALLTALAATLQKRSRGGRALWAVARVSAVWLMVASCGKDDPAAHDISMPIDDFPASAELYLSDQRAGYEASADVCGGRSFDTCGGWWTNRMHSR